jgi:putative flippase GtrA
MNDKPAAPPAAPGLSAMVRRLAGLRPVRFLVVGGFNTAFSYTIYVIALYAGLPYALANLCALLLGILFSFRTQGALVFGNRDGSLIWRFAAAWGVIYGFNICLIGLLVRAGLNAYVAGAVALPFTSVLSYVIQKRVVFGRKRSS